MDPEVSLVLLLLADLESRKPGDLRAVLIEQRLDGLLVIANVGLLE